MLVPFFTELDSLPPILRSAVTLPTNPFKNGTPFTNLRECLYNLLNSVFLSETKALRPPEPNPPDQESEKFLE